MGVGPHKVRDRCGLCRREKLTKVLDLGNTPLANEYLTKAEVGALHALNIEQEVFPLALVRCEACKHVQTSVVVDAVRLFSHYLYATGTSPVTVEHFTEYAREIVTKYHVLDKPNHGSVIEIGSNDGTMLKAFKSLGVGKVLGIDPAANLAQEAKQAGVETLVGFFDKQTGEQLASIQGKADVVVANNVLAHAEDILDILEGVRAVIADKGIFVFEVSYLMDMFEHLAFDTIYHEHFAYHTIGPLTLRLDSIGMRIVDVQRTPEQMGRGSIRIFAAPYTAEDRNEDWFTSSLVGEGFTGRITPMSMEEYGVHQNMVPWNLLGKAIAAEGNVLRNKISDYRRRGMVVCGYGAPAKMTTLVYAMSLPPVDYVIEDAQLKIGRHTPGQHVPIVGPKGVERPPAVCILFAWNFADSIVKRWREGHVTGIDGQPLPVPIFVHPLSSAWT
jgi:2-polyprenyl-3-methyl-5-hydroxy-6-metoxy-1,4-benzoquinol methylase